MSMEWDFQVEEADGQGPGVGGAYCVRETREGHQKGGWRKPLRGGSRGLEEPGCWGRVSWAV